MSPSAPSSEDLATPDECVLSALVRRPVKLVLTAVDFGYGPAAALSGFLQDFSLSSKVCSFLYLPRDLQHLLSADGFLAHRRVPMPLSASQMGKSALSGAIVVNFGNIDLVRSDPVWLHHIFVDCVGWLSQSSLPSADELVSRRITHVVECFPLSELILLNRAVVVVRPSIPAKVSAPSSPIDVLITVGGGCLPSRPTKNPVIDIARMIACELSSQCENLRVVVTGGGSEDRIVQSVPQHVHGAMASTAGVVVTVPGLYTVFEALRGMRPLLLLPPTNYTQAAQFGAYASYGLVDPALDWRSLLPDWANVDGRRPLEIAAEIDFSHRLRRELDNPIVRSEILNRAVPAILRRLMSRAHPDVEVYDKLKTAHLNARLPSVGDIVNDLIRTATP